MCLTFFCLHPHNHPHIKFIMGFNREEQTHRQTLKFAQFKEDNNIYGGRDLKSGGTWLGVNIQTGILVFLTNYDLPQMRMGKSRGKLVYSFLATTFVPQGQRQNTDQIITAALKQVSKHGQQYAAFNLTIFNMRTEKLFYICSEWPLDKSHKIEQKAVEGICNSDIETLWPKTSHGLSKFQSIVNDLGKMNEQQAFLSMETVFKDKTRFSQIDDDESSIFVEPYWCVAEQAERMTKTTFLCLLIAKEDHKELVIQETTYVGKQAVEEKVRLNLKIMN